MYDFLCVSLGKMSIWNEIECVTFKESYSFQFITDVIYIPPHRTNRTWGSAGNLVVKKDFKFIL